jgi:hypothetical protein
LLLKSHYDSGSDDSETAAEGPPVPISEARRRLAKLLIERTEANSEMASARAAIAKLTATQNLAAPFEQQLAMLGEAESQALRLWSGDDGDATPPAQDFERRAALERKIGECRSTAAAAQRAIPGLESEFTRASHKALAITWSVSATIGEILLAEIEPRFVEIAEIKAALAAAISRAEAGREIALRGVESIPADRRTMIAAQFYAELATLEKVRIAAAANPPPSYDRGTWGAFARGLAVDHPAVSGHHAEG